MDRELIGFVVAAGGWSVAIITITIGYLERSRAREEERLGRTLDYFDGGSQRRSIGISLIEGVWVKKRRFDDIIVPLVANQVVYLLLSTESRDPHNERNLVRLVMTLQAIPNLAKRYHERWGDVCDAIYRKYEGESKGIPVSKPTLRLWAKALGYDLGA
jgi:hypothetical protein